MWRNINKAGDESQLLISLHVELDILLYQENFEFKAIVRGQPHTAMSLDQDL